MASFVGPRRPRPPGPQLPPAVRTPELAPEDQPSPFTSRIKELEAPEESPFAGRIRELEGVGAEAQQTNIYSDALSGFNGRLADALGVPIEAVGAGLRALNLTDVPPGQAQQDIRALFTSTGLIRKQQVDNLAGKIGEAGFDNALLTAAFFYNAPMMAARTGMNVIDYTARNLGKFMLERPGTVLAGDVGAAIGAPVGQELGGLPGAVAGGIAGASTVSGLYAGLKVPVQLAIRSFTPAFKEALRPKGASADIPRRFAEDQIAHDKHVLDVATQSAIQSIPLRGPSAGLSVAVRRGLERAERIGRRLESRLWRRVPKQQRVDITNLFDVVNRISREATNVSLSRLPNNPAATGTQEGFLDQIAKLARPSKSGKSYTPPTIERLLGLRSDILRASRLERSQAAPNEALLRNYAILEKAILDDIQRAIPGDVSLQQARAFSTHFNDLFTRGPIGQVLRYQRPGDPRVDPELTVSRLLGTHGGPEAAAKVAQDLRQPKIMADFEDTVRAMFREALDDGVEQGNRFVLKHRDALRSMSQVAAETEGAVDEFARISAQRTALEKSALSKYIQYDPLIAIERLFTAKNPGAETADLMETFRQDGEALNGFRAGLLDALFDKVGHSGIRLGEAMKTPLRRIFVEALTPEQLARLDKNIRLAGELEQGHGRFFRGYIKGPISILAQVLGARFGSKVSHLEGGRGNIQTPQVFSKVFRGWTERVLQTLTSDELLARAIIDPRWEKVLSVRVPSTPLEAKRYGVKLRRLIGVLQGLEVNAVDRLDSEGE